MYYNQDLANFFIYCFFFVSGEQDITGVTSLLLLENNVPSTNVLQPGLGKFFHLLFNFCMGGT
jgi:hypothetical protein